MVVSDSPSVADSPPAVTAPEFPAELPGVATPVEALENVAVASAADTLSAETRGVSASLSSEKAPEPIPTIVVRPGVEFETASPVVTSSSAAPVAVVEAPVAEPPVVAPPVAAAPVEAPPSPVSASTPSAPAVIVPGVGDARERDTERPLTVLMVTSEAVPFAKTGGLADVAGALPGALGRLGHEVTVVLPRYRGVAVSGEPIHTRVVQLGQDRHTVKIYEEPLGPHARAWLIDEPALFDREGIYGTNGSGDHQDNPRRFALLAARRSKARAAWGSRPTSCTRTTGRRVSRRSI